MTATTKNNYNNKKYVDLILNNINIYFVWVKTKQTDSNLHYHILNIWTSRGGKGEKIMIRFWQISALLVSSDEKPEKMKLERSISRQRSVVHFTEGGDEIWNAIVGT